MDHMKVDLHNHFKHGSYFSNGDFNRVVNIIEKKLGPNSIVGLVNFDDSRYETFSNLPGYEREDFGNAIYLPDKGIVIAKGQEIETKEGHVLVMGLQKSKHLRSSRSLSLEDAVKEARDNNGIIIADHPFYIDGIGQYLEKNPSLLEYFDAIEVHNGEAVWLPLFTPRNANQKARGFYEEIKSDFDIGALSSSDGHSFGEIGSSYSYLPQIEFRDSETLTSSLRKAIREHKNLDNDRRHNSTFPALNHAAHMAFLIFTGKVKI